MTVISAIILGCIPVLAEREKKAHSLPTKLKRDETTVVMISRWVRVLPLRLFSLLLIHTVLFVVYLITVASALPLSRPSNREH